MNQIQRINCRIKSQTFFELVRFITSPIPHKILASKTLLIFNTPIFGILISNFSGRLICKPEQLSKELSSEFFLLSLRFERQWKRENRIQKLVLVNIKLSAKIMIPPHQFFFQFILFRFQKNERPYISGVKFLRLGNQRTWFLDLINKKI